MAILLIEDDPDLGKLLTQYLEMNDMEVVLAADGKTAYEYMGSTNFELAVIDIMLPDTSGFEIAKTIKHQVPDMPFLFLTARNKKEDIILGLKLGACDYMTKPFEPEVLVLRINFALRKNLQELKTDPEIGNSKLKLSEYRLCTPGKEYKLTSRETELLSFIIKNKNRLIKREYLLQTIWGENDYFLGRSMDVFISRLRKYFKEDTAIHIETFRGVGYIFRDTS